MVGSLLTGGQMGNGAEKERDRVEAALLLLLPSDLSLLFFCFCAMWCESTGGEEKDGRRTRGYYGNCGCFFFLEGYSSAATTLYSPTRGVPV